MIIRKIRDSQISSSNVCDVHQMLKQICNQQIINEEHDAENIMLYY